MSAPTFMSKMNQQKRPSRTAPADVPDEDDNNYSVHEYKKCMEDIKSEHPHLSTGAMQQMTLERCVKIHEERGEQHHKKRFPEPADLLRGMMGKLRIGKNKSQRKSGGSRDELGLTVDSSTLDPDLSLAVRQSARCLVAHSDDLSESSENENSLRGSLENIERSYNISEKPFNSNRQGRRHSALLSRRISDLSCDLPNVDEDEELKPYNKGAILAAQPSFKGKRNTSVGEDQQFYLPGEIKAVLDNFGDDKNDKNTNSGPGQRKPNSNRQVRRHSERCSIQSSELSLDLSDVEDDAKRRSSNEGANVGAQASFKGKPNPSEGEDQPFQQSLPNEIKAVLNDFGGNKNDKDTNSGPGQSDRRAFYKSQCDSAAPPSRADESNNSDFMSSFLSIDSANFNGDFSAWASFRKSSK